MNTAHAEGSAPTPYRVDRTFGRLLVLLLKVTEYLSAAILAVDVAIVFISVICRYFLHHPLEWTEEIASSLMVGLVFLGAATVIARRGHASLEAARRLFPESWRRPLDHICRWIILGVSVALFISGLGLLQDSQGQTTPLGFSQGIFTYPLVAGSALMVIFGFANAIEGPWSVLGATLIGLGAAVGAFYEWNAFVPALSVSPGVMMIGGFIVALVIGMPIAFALGFASLLYFLFAPSMPLLVYSQQVMSGASQFVLLAIPFFILAGLAMEANGMSTRLIELLVRLIGRMRGGLNVIMIVATAFFSGISGSKLADIAAVGSILMPAIRRTRQDPNDAAGLLASTAVMSETIPPCVNIIIFGFVANVSIGGLFLAGLIPAGVLAIALIAVAIWFGTRVNPDEAFEKRRSMWKLVGGSMVALLMVLMIGRGVTSGIATSTEVSAFAVVYALVIGGLAFRELSLAKIIELFMRAAAMTGATLFIVAAATSLSFALAIEQIPQSLATGLVALGQSFGKDAFLFVAVLLMILFGAVLEGAPALIIFGPLLTPIAVQLGVNPLHFGTVVVVAMGLGLFSPPVGLGLFATCTITGTEMPNVVRPMLKYLVVLFAALMLLVFVPEFSLWLPRRFGFQ
jgi:tripartite ATP-independent transporter DctM subunit